MSKILVIDDEASIRTLLKVTLTHKGYEVILAENGKKGIEVFKEARPSIVITDIKMPGMDGIEVLKQLKALDADVRVIVITGHGDMDSAVEALKFEASDFINKPITDDALTIAIKRSEEILWLKRKLRKYTGNLESMVKEATEKLQTAHDFQKNLIESSIDGIVAADKNGTVIVFNQAAESLLGYDADEVVEKMPMGEICSHDLCESIEDKLRGEEFRGENRLVNYEAVVRSKYGEDIPVRLSGVRLSEGGVETGKVCFLQDLREIKRLQRELIDNERVAATGQAVAGMAHYIKNVLNGLQGGVYMVNIGLNKNKPERLHKGWAVVQNNIGRISNLVMNMLTYSREREPDYEYCSPNEIAQEVFDLLERKAEEDNIELAKDFDVSLKEWFLDPRGIHRCLLNLVGNALDACVLDPDESKAKSVVIRTREEDGYVRFDVADNGMGMNREVQSSFSGASFLLKVGGEQVWDFL